MRWRYIVDWRLQGSLVLHGLIYGVLVLVGVGAGIFTPLLVELGGVDPRSAIEDQSIVMLYMHERFWFITGICLVLVAAGAVHFSHRVAGPMVRFKRNLRLLAEGRIPPPLRTRPGDFLVEEVSCLNEAVAGVGERVDAIRRAQSDLRRRLEELGGDAAEELGELAEACAEVDRAVRSFRYVETPDTPRGKRKAVGVAEPVEGV